jgi:hypothetical protein
MKAADTTINRVISELCYEIDDLKQQIQFWRERYEQEVQERNQETNQRIEQTNKDIGNLLCFALSVRDNENGDLVIPATERKQLAENYK